MMMKVAVEEEACRSGNPALHCVCVSVLHWMQRRPRCQGKLPAGAEAAERSHPLTHTQPEAVEGMSVDAVQLADQSDGKLHHDSNLRLLPLFVLQVQTKSPSCRLSLSRPTKEQRRFTKKQHRSLIIMSD